MRRRRPGANYLLLHPDTGVVTCVVEIQFCHDSMLTARKDLPGHLVYNPVRVAMELLERWFSSSGFTADAIALVELHQGCLPDGGNAVGEVARVESDHESFHFYFQPGFHHASAKGLQLEDKAL